MSKILYVASNMQHINNFHIPYIEKLRSEGHTVKVMATGEGADFDLPFVKKMLSPRNLLTQRKIRRIVIDEGFDSVILNTSLAAFHVRMALPKKNRPRVLNIVHGYLFHEKDKGLKKKVLLACEKMLKSKTDAIAVMNAEDERIARENSLTSGEIIMTRGMGARVAEESFPRESVRRYSSTEGKFLLTFVGELSDRKNQRFLISALPEIKIAIPTAELLFLGEGGIEKQLKEIAESLNISSAVHFMGRKSNPCDFIRATDLYVTASEIEGMPFNVIEALGCAVPILASDIKGHTDLIEDGEEGYLYERGNVADFVAKVKAFAMGDVTVDRERQIEKYTEYSFDRVFDETYSVIKEFVK